MRILVLHPGALGDIILSLPALSLLRRSLPGAHITFAGNLDFAGIIGEACADRIHSLASLPVHRLFVPDEIPSDDRRFWNSFDRIVSWIGAGDPILKHNLERIHSNARIAAWKPVEGDPRHASRIFADSLRPWIEVPDCLTFPPDCIRYDLRSGVFPGASGLAAVHPGAGSETKRWPLVSFESIVRELLPEFGLPIVLFEGPAERGVAQGLAGRRPGGGIEVASCLPLTEVAGLLSRSRIFVGNDTGISHLAAAMGVPSLVLFGPSLPLHWAPLGEHVQVLRETSRCAACLGLEGAKHSCMAGIGVAEVCTQVRRMLNKNGVCR